MQWRSVVISCANRIPGSFFSFIGARKEPGYTIQVVRHVRSFTLTEPLQTTLVQKDAAKILKVDGPVLNLH